MPDSYTFADYVHNNYLTLLLLGSLIILLIVNRGAKISGLHYIRSIIGIVFALTLNVALEDACDAYQWNYRILYFKTTLSVDRIAGTAAGRTGQAKIPDHAPVSDQLRFSMHQPV
jgi:hypothetical protein